MHDANRRPAPSPRRLPACLMDALDVIQRSALFSDAVDWDGVYRDARAVLSRAEGYDDIHQ